MSGATPIAALALAIIGIAWLTGSTAVAYLGGAMFLPSACWVAAHHASQGLG